MRYLVVYSLPDRYSEMIISLSGVAVFADNFGEKITQYIKQ